MPIHLEWWNSEGETSSIIGFTIFFTISDSTVNVGSTMKSMNPAGKKKRFTFIFPGEDKYKLEVYISKKSIYIIMDTEKYCNSIVVCYIFSLNHQGIILK